MNTRSALSTLVVLGALLDAPALCRADEGEHGADAPSMFSYGLRGFWTGAELGLGVGFLTTGSHFQSGEWRKLVLGAGIGAIAGIGAGISLAIVDADHARPPTGWFVLRDMGYGATLGALAGAAVGALFWVNHGRGHDVLEGLAIGGLIGAGAGLAFGLIEAANAKPPSHQDGVNARGLRLTLAAAPDGKRMPSLMPTLLGRF